MVLHRWGVGVGVGSWYCKLATEASFKADISRVSPSPERVDERLPLEISALGTLCGGPITSSTQFMKQNWLVDRLTYLLTERSSERRVAAWLTGWITTLSGLLTTESFWLWLADCLFIRRENVFINYIPVRLLGRFQDVLNGGSAKRLLKGDYTRGSGACFHRNILKSRSSER